MTLTGQAPICVFIGPTIDVNTARRHLPQAAFLPPAAQGDVYRCARAQPKAIAIIDGYFERVPAVWHKEVLWALSQGIPVYGSSSMGALRAAELTTFGMVGVGWIYRQLADGLLTDDDEVAIVHASAEDDYRAGSEAMVNIRRTLTAAHDQGVLTEKEASLLTARAKMLFYPERCWPQVVQDAREVFGQPTATALREWLRTGRVDQKKLDAIALLNHLAAEDPQPVSVPWRFNHTVYWSEMAGSSALDIRAVESPNESGGRVDVTAEAILDELRLDHDAFKSAFRSALIRTMAGMLADRMGLQAAEQSVEALAQRHFTTLGINSDEDLESWLLANRLGRRDVYRLAESEAQYEQVNRRLSALAMAGLIDYLRWSGALERLAVRARRKDEVLGAVGMDAPTIKDTGADPSVVYERWFEANGMTQPADVDTWARESGYGDVHRFRRMMLRELVFQRMECA
jgi:hypothetical protein